MGYSHHLTLHLYWFSQFIWIHNSRNILTPPGGILFENCWNFLTSSSPSTHTGALPLTLFHSYIFPELPYQIWFSNSHWSIWIDQISTLRKSQKEVMQISPYCLHIVVKSPLIFILLCFCEVWWPLVRKLKQFVVAYLYFGLQKCVNNAQLVPVIGMYLHWFEKHILPDINKRSSPGERWE